MCAKSAIQNNPEMKIFYHRRLEQGKNKMSTINIIRINYYHEFLLL